MYTYICRYIHVYIYTCMCIYMYVYMYVYIYIYTHTHMYIYTCFWDKLQHCTAAHKNFEWALSNCLLYCMYGIICTIVVVLRLVTVSMIVIMITIEIVLKICYDCKNMVMIAEFQCVAACCSVLQRVAACCSVSCDQGVPR